MRFTPSGGTRGGTRSGSANAGTTADARRTSHARQTPLPAEATDGSPRSTRAQLPRPCAFHRGGHARYHRACEARLPGAHGQSAQRIAACPVVTPSAKRASGCKCRYVGARKVDIRWRRRGGSGWKEWNRRRKTYSRRPATGSRWDKPRGKRSCCGRPLRTAAAQVFTDLGAWAALGTCKL